MASTSTASCNGGTNRTAATPRACSTGAGRCWTDEGEHPLLRALWEPRLLRQLEEVGALLAADRADGVATLGWSGKAS